MDKINAFVIQSTIQYFYSYLNDKFYNNELKPTIIAIVNKNDYRLKVKDIVKGEKNSKNADVVAFFEKKNYTIFKRNVISINAKYVYEMPRDLEHIYFLIQTLLHEMAHQYCYMNNIKDTNDKGEHTEEFINVAQEHGLKIHKKAHLSNYMDIKKEYVKEIKEAIQDYLIIYDFDYQTFYKNLNMINGEKVKKTKIKEFCKINKFPLDYFYKLIERKDI